MGKVTDHLHGYELVEGREEGVGWESVGWWKSVEKTGRERESC